MIEIEALRYHYPNGTAALEGIDVTIPDGQFVLVCGSNGSGKTTLIRLINGLLMPTAGCVRVDGFDTRRSEREVLQRVGMVFQEADTQILGETVGEDVAFGPENLGLSRDEVDARVLAALETVGLEKSADRSCHLLSGGEKRRLAIAGVLAVRPRILIFDEPFANLDYSGTRQVLQEILKLHESGHTVLVTTHDVEKIIAHVDRVVVLSKGRLTAEGAPENVIPELPRHNIRPPCYSLLGAKAISWLSD